MKQYIWKNLNQEDRTRLLSRPPLRRDQKKQVREIIENVRIEKDLALNRYAAEFDKTDPKQLVVSQFELQNAWDGLDDTLKEALLYAKENIEKYHGEQATKPRSTTPRPGIKLSQVTRPVSNVGLYIPGGSAPLFSTVLMLAIPASIAGCKRIAICSPSRNPTLLAAAFLCGVSEFYNVGGAQAIAALAYGTETISKVDKIFGPGNSWVNEAKAQVSTDVSIDMPAGPSEVMVIADTAGQSEFIAWDLLSQAEHGPDSQVILITTSPDLAKNVQEKISDILLRSPRAETTRKSLENSLIILVDGVSEALKISNFYGPEHLIIQTKNPAADVERVENAGSVFVGQFSSESAGDYLSGTNHVLPTGGTTSSYSGLTLSSFQKTISVQEISPEGILNIGKRIEILANAEGLYCHGQAAKVRREAVNANL